VVGAPGAPALAWLAEGMVAWRGDQRDEAARLLARAIDDVRAGSVVRAIAHVYAARLAEAAGDGKGAASHRAAAVALAAPDATWLRGGGSPGSPPPAGDAGT